MRVAVVVALAVGLGGCVSQEAPPQVAASPQTKCDAVFDALTHPAASPTTKQVAMEVGRNNGCFGQAPVQRLQVEHTIKVQ